MIALGRLFVYFREMRFSPPGKTVLLCGFWLFLSACSQFSENNIDEQKDPHYLAGKEKAEQHDYTAAIESFEKALESNPRSAAAHFELGVLYETHINDYLAAGYHYERFLHLRPDSNLAEVVRQRITACKVEISKTVSFGIPTQEVQRNFEKLMNENTSLKTQMETLRIQLAQRPLPATNSPAPARIVQTNLPTRTNTQAPVPTVRSSPPPAPVVTAAKTHTVKSGENPMGISRQYGISLEAFMAANPGLNPRKMHVGQVVNIPTKR